MNLWICAVLSRERERYDTCLMLILSGNLELNEIMHAAT